MARKKISKSIKAYFSFVSILIASISVVLVFYTSAIAMSKIAHPKHDDKPVFRISNLKLNVEERKLTFNWENIAPRTGGVAKPYVWFVGASGHIGEIHPIRSIEDLIIDTIPDSILGDLGACFISGQETKSFSGRIGGYPWGPWGPPGETYKLDLLKSMVIHIDYVSIVLDENLKPKDAPIQILGRHHFTKGYSYNPSENSFIPMPADKLEETLEPIRKEYPRAFNDKPVFRISSPELKVEEARLTFNFMNTTAGVHGNVMLYVWLVTSTGEIIPIAAGGSVNPIIDTKYDVPIYLYGQEIRTFSSRIKKDVKMDLLHKLVIRMDSCVWDRDFECQEGRQQFTVGYSYNPSANRFNLMSPDQLEETLKPIREKNWHPFDETY